MPSELARIRDEKHSAEFKECKRRIMNATADTVEFVRLKLVEILPDLRAIHEKKLWRFGYGSFKEFCEKVLHYSRQSIYQLFMADNVRKELGDNGQVSNFLTPLPDGSVVELKGLPPDQAQKVVEEATESHPKRKPTAAKIKEARARVIDPEKHADIPPEGVKKFDTSAPDNPAPETREIKRCPQCGQEIK